MRSLTHEGNLLPPEAEAIGVDGQGHWWSATIVRASTTSSSLRPSRGGARLCQSASASCGLDERYEQVSLSMYEPPLRSFARDLYARGEGASEQRRSGC